MSSATIDQVFSVPFRHLRSTHFSGDQMVSTHQPNGLARFVGDQQNQLLKYLILPMLPNDQADNKSLQTELQWPLVLFGPSGTGKTSLAMTVVSELADRFQSQHSESKEKNSPNSKPIYLSAVDFDRRFRTAIETDSVEDLRNRLMQSKGVVIDDIHQLVNKPAAQAEFMIILDRMSRKNWPIVITMDCSPQECTGLSSRLVSRLLGGLSIPVNPPGEKARAEIIRDLAEINGLDLTDDAVSLLVDRLNVTVPKLNHFFAQVKNSLKAEKGSEENSKQIDQFGGPIDAAKLTRIFKRSSTDNDQLSRLIIKEVAKEFHLKTAELKSNSRKQTIVLARGIAIYLNRTLLGTSFSKIGSYFGGRDHSTIMHAYRKVEAIVADTDSANTSNSTIYSIEKLKQTLTEQLASQTSFI